jgi:hypothetical protein
MGWGYITGFTNLPGHRLAHLCSLKSECSRIAIWSLDGDVPRVAAAAKSSEKNTGAAFDKLLATPDGLWLIGLTTDSKSVYLIDAATAEWAASLHLLGDTDHVVRARDGSYTATPGALKWLSVASGKRSWPLADVPAYAARFFRANGIDLASAVKAPKQ